MRLARFLALAAVVGFAPAARADVTPHPLFTDHMVLQRETDVPVWGLAAPGTYINIPLPFGKMVNAEAGEFSMTLAAEKGTAPDCTAKLKPLTSAPAKR